VLSQQLRRGLSPILLVFFSVFVLGGCAGSFQRTGEEISSTHWQAFTDIERDFGKIEPGRTTVAELETLGFGPGSENIRTVNYLVLRGYLLGDTEEATAEDLPQEVQSCLSLKDACYGLIINVGRLDEIGHESFYQRVVEKRIQSEFTGWKFEAVILVNGGSDLVVYAQSIDTQPNIHKFVDKKDPQGFLENLIGPFLAIPLL